MKIDNFYSSIAELMSLVNDSDGSITHAETLDGSNQSDDHDR